MDLVETGYKMTEVGWIPEDWTVKRFEEIGRFFKGKGIKKDEIRYEGNPCVRYGELYTRYDNVINETFSFISNEIAEQSVKLRRGDLLFAGSGETKEDIGKSAVIMRDDTYAGGDIVVFRAKNIDCVFLGFMSNSIPVSKQKAVNGQGDAVVHIYARGISKIKIPLPPTLAEQKAIATALSDVDALISSLDKLIEKKKAIKQGAMQELLTPPNKGGKRLDGFSGEWEEKKLGELTELITKGTTPTSVGKQFTDEGINFIKAESINKNGSIITEKVAHIDNDTHELLGRSKMKNNDLLFTIAGVLGRIGMIQDQNLPANTNQAVAIIRLKKSLTLSVSFFFHVLRTSFIEKHIESISVQGAQANFSLTDVNNIPLTIPLEFEEQEAIANTLSDMDSGIQKLETKRDKYKQIKQGMMQELLTGKTRLI